MNNFTPRAQQVLQLARKEADRFNHNYVGTEHLLLGLIKLGQGVAVNVLQKMGLDLETVRMEVEKQVGSGPETKMVGNIFVSGPDPTCFSTSIRTVSRSSPIFCKTFTATPWPSLIRPSKRCSVPT